GRIALARAARRELLDLVTTDADPVQQRVHGELRMLDHRRYWPLVVAIAARHEPPRWFVQTDVGPGQHDCAVRKGSTGCDKLGGGGHGAGRARDDHRASASPE